jgi:hypothetical protein
MDDLYCMPVLPEVTSRKRLLLAVSFENGVAGNVLHLNLEDHNG